MVVTKESHWYKFFESNDNYDPDRIEYDREQLRKFYRNHGYYDFHVVSSVAELSPDHNSFGVTYTVDEGARYKFGKLTVTTELKKLNPDILKRAAADPRRPGLRGPEDRAGDRRADLRRRLGGLRLRRRAARSTTPIRRPTPST